MEYTSIFVYNGTNIVFTRKMVRVFANGPEDQSSITGWVRLKKWYLMPPCLTLSIIRYGSRIKWSNLGKGVASSPILRYSSYCKGSLLVALNYCQPTFIIWSIMLFLMFFYAVCIYIYIYIYITLKLAQSAGAIEYTECISAEILDSLNKCPGYDTKQSDGEAPGMLELWVMLSTPLLPLLTGPCW